MIIIAIERIVTPDGIRYIGIVTPHADEPHPEIESVGSGWCLSPVEAEAQARRLYALALSVSEVEVKVRAA